jgi:hypothetical protein
VQLGERDGVHAYVAIDRRGTEGRNDPVHLQRDSELSGDGCRQLDLEALALTCLGGKGQCSRVCA